MAAVPPLPLNFGCLICLGPLDEPLCCKAGHVFCQLCLSEWRRHWGKRTEPPATDDIDPSTADKAGETRVECPICRTVGVPIRLIGHGANAFGRMQTPPIMDVGVLPPPGAGDSVMSVISGPDADRSTALATRHSFSDAGIDVDATGAVSSESTSTVQSHTRSVSPYVSGHVGTDPSFISLRMLRMVSDCEHTFRMKEAATQRWKSMHRVALQEKENALARVYELEATVHQLQSQLAQLEPSHQYQYITAVTGCVAGCEAALRHGGPLPDLTMPTGEHEPIPTASAESSAAAQAQGTGHALNIASPSGASISSTIKGPLDTLLIRLHSLLKTVADKTTGLAEVVDSVDHKRQSVVHEATGQVQKYEGQLRVLRQAVNASETHSRGKIKALLEENRSLSAALQKQQQELQHARKEEEEWGQVVQELQEKSQQQQEQLSRELRVTRQAAEQSETHARVRIKRLMDELRELKKSNPTSSSNTSTSTSPDSIGTVGVQMAASSRPTNTNTTTNNGNSPDEHPAVRVGSSPGTVGSHDGHDSSHLTGESPQLQPQRHHRSTSTTRTRHTDRRSDASMDLQLAYPVRKRTTSSTNTNTSTIVRLSIPSAAAQSRGKSLHLHQHHSPPHVKTTLKSSELIASAVGDDGAVAHEPAVVSAPKAAPALTSKGFGRVGLSSPIPRLSNTVSSASGSVPSPSKRRRVRL